MLPISSGSQAESPRVAPSLNREAWLEALAEKLRSDFESVGLPLPEVIHYAPGFPSKMALSKKKRRIGEHWHGRASKDSGHQIFISPLLTDDIEVAETLVHELLHAALPAGSKHGPKFKAGMQKLGLEGKADRDTCRPAATHSARGIGERTRSVSTCRPQCLCAGEETDHQDAQGAVREASRVHRAS